MKFNPDQLPAAYKRAYDALPATGKAVWEARRLQGQTDHMFLASELLGWDFQPVPHGGEHGLFSNFLQKDPKQEASLYDLDTKVKKRMILWPRGTFKSTAVAVEIAQLIINFPNIRILIMSGSKDLSKRQLARVKKIFEKPTRSFRELYPDFCGEDLGNQEEFTVPNRTLDVLAEPTVAISSARSITSGSHFDVIFIDDLVNNQNYQKASALEKCWEDYKSTGPLLAPSGFVFVTGTRYSFGDTYERIQEAAEAELKSTGRSIWKISIRSCWYIACKTCGHLDVTHKDKRYTHPPCSTTGCECKQFVDSGIKKVLFPQFRTADGRTEGHTVEFLEGERNEKGDEFFANQYENNPIALGTQTFTPELINAQSLYHVKQLPESGHTFVVGDLSYIGSNKGDKSVLYVCRMLMGQIFVIHCQAGKWDSQEVAENVLFLAMKYRPSMIWLERFLGWEAYNNIILSLANKYNVQQLPLDWIKMNQKEDAKNIRIGGIKSWLVQKKLWLFAGMPGYEVLVSQLKKWPKTGRNDDYADCLGYVCEVPSGAALEKLPSQMKSSLDYIRSMNQTSETGSSSYEDQGCGSGITC